MALVNLYFCSCYWIYIDSTAIKLAKRFRVLALTSSSLWSNMKNEFSTES